MITLPNGCRCGDIKVTPSGWDTKKLKPKDMAALLKKEWYIHYRFYDPTITDRNGKIKPYMMKIRAGLNTIKDFSDRCASATGLVEKEWTILQEHPLLLSIRIETITI